MFKNVLLAVCIAAAGAVALAQDASKEPRDEGLLVRLYQFDASVSSLPEVVANQPASDVIWVETLDLRDGKFGSLKDNFVSLIDGYLLVKETGSFVFRLASDDGSKLWIDDVLIVDNDGLHGPTPKDSIAFELTAGEHRLKIRHFEVSGGEALALLWKPPGAADFSVVPKTALAHLPTKYHTEPGAKRVIPPLRRGLAGDGSPVSGLHPAVTHVTPEKEKAWIPTVPARSGIFAIDSPMPNKQVPVLWIPGEATRDRSYVIEFPFAPYTDNALIVSKHGETYRIRLRPKRKEGFASRFSYGPGATLEQPSGKLAFEMLEARVMTNGLEIEFTKPLDPRCGWEADSYYIEQWAYDFPGGKVPTRDGVVYPAKSASVSEDRKKVFVEVDGLKPSSVIYLRLLPPCVSADGERPWTTEAWITYIHPNTDRTGAVLPRPPQPPLNLLTDEEKKEGWTLLFDGKSTDSWRGFKQSKMPAGWQAVDGCLMRVGSGGDIVTKEQYANFELKLDWRIAPAGNSGIFFHVSEDAPNNAVWETGPEMQVLDNAEHPDGRSLLTSAGSNYALVAPTRDVTRPVGFFNEARLLVKDGHVEHWLNGEKLLEYDLGSPQWEKFVAASKFKDMPRYGRPQTGHIALQDHGDKVWFRNIKIRKLD